MTQSLIPTGRLHSQSTGRPKGPTDRRSADAWAGVARRSDVLPEQISSDCESSLNGLPNTGRAAFADLLAKKFRKLGVGSSPIPLARSLSTIYKECTPLILIA
jgi:hypothetical protein